MNTQRNFFIVLAIIMISGFSAYAVNTPDSGKLIVKVEQTDIHALQLQLANLLDLRTEVRISDTSGKLWYKEVVKKETGFGKKFNLTIIPEGNYILSVKNEADSYLQAFAKNETVVAFFQDEVEYEKTKQMARLVSGNAASSYPLMTKINTTEDQAITLQLANLLQEIATIKLNKMRGSCQWAQTVENETGMTKKFSMESTANGEYYFLVHHKSTIVMQFFTVEDGDVQLGKFQRLDLGRDVVKLTSK
ncbi:MAG: hypothetical protein AAF502_02895 [Bacteroidota bacterium]